MSTLVGKKAPKFSATAVIDGKSIVRNYGIDQFIGKKYVLLFFSEALKLGFRKNTKKVWFHTCSLDHKHALKNYLGRGMKIFKSETINLDIS